ncbi:MAG: inositol monophosphatase family protein [Planctomycetota bacterium]
MSSTRQEILELATDIAREAGRTLMWFYERPREKHARMKGLRDPVTDADVASENLIAERIRQRFPDHAILAEEKDRGRADGEHLWIVDPLDATVNFLHGHPLFAVSIAYYHRGVGEVGVVYAPYLGEMFTAARGEGCRLNGKLLEVSKTEALDQSVLATGFHYQRHEQVDNNVARFTHLILQVRGIRRGGCASLDLAYVAAGRFDGYWELWLSPYDVAAGAILVREAGGRVTDLGDGDEWLHGGQILATNGPMHETLRAELAAAAPR